MQKALAKALDETDQWLIYQLQQDARQSNVSLATKLGLTEGAVRRRIDNLLRAGVLRIVAVAKPEMVGLPIHAMFGLRVDLKRLEMITKELELLEELSYVYETTGQFDLFVAGFFESTETLRDFVMKKLASTEGVVHADTFLVMRTAKRSFQYGAPPLAPARTGETQAEADPDEAPPTSVDPT